MIEKHRTRVRVDVAIAGMTQGRETGKSRKRRERQPRSKGVICANPRRVEKGIAPFVRQKAFCAKWVTVRAELENR